MVRRYHFCHSSQSEETRGPHPSGSGVGTLVLYCAQEIEMLLQSGRKEIGEDRSG